MILVCSICDKDVEYNNTKFDLLTYHSLYLNINFQGIRLLSSGRTVCKQCGGDND